MQSESAEVSTEVRREACYQWIAITKSVIATTKSVIATTKNVIANCKQEIFPVF